MRNFRNVRTTRPFGGMGVRGGLRVVLELQPEDVAALEKELEQISPAETPVAHRLVEAVLGNIGRRFLSPREVAGLFEVSERAVRKWCEQRKIVAFQPAGRRGEWRIPADQFAATPEQIRAFRQTTQAIAAKHGYVEGIDYEQ